MTDYSLKNCTTLFYLIGDDLNEELFSGEISNGFFIKGFSLIVTFVFPFFNKSSRTLLVETTPPTVTVRSVGILLKVHFQ